MEPFWRGNMEDLKTILTSHHSRNNSDIKGDIEKLNEPLKATTSEIPDLFFDEILIQFKLSRVEILVLMHLYRVTWCRPNLHRKFGIAPIISHLELSASLGLSMDELYQSIRKLENLGFIETIRSGQYFVRKYFTEDLDQKYSQTYDNFF